MNLLPTAGWRIALTNEDGFKQKETAMKKILLLCIIGLFLIGCGTPAQKQAFKENSTLYASYSHLKFSWRGYKNPTAEMAKTSDAEGWWGEPIEVPYGLK